MYATTEYFEKKIASLEERLLSEYQRGREDAANDVRDRGFALWSHRPDERRMSAGVLPALMAAARGDGEQA